MTSVPSERAGAPSGVGAGRRGTPPATPAAATPPDRVAVPPGVLGRDPPLLAGDPHRGPPAGRRPAPPATRPAAAVRAPARPRRARAPHTPPPTGRPAGAAGRAPRRPTRRRAPRVSAWSSSSSSARALGIEQLAQLLGPEQLAQQVAVEGERLRAAIHERRVALVHVDGDVVEQERAAKGEARRVSTLTSAISRRSMAARSSRRAGRSKTSWRHSRYVSRTIGKEPYRLATARSCAERWRICQSGRRCAAAAPRQQQGAGRVLAEARREERRAAERARRPGPRPRPRDATADSAAAAPPARAGFEARRRRRSSSSARVPARWAAGASSVAGSRRTMPSSDQSGCDLDAQPLAQAGLDGQRPGRVDPAAERRQQADRASRRARRGSARGRSSDRSAGRPSPRAPRPGRRAGCSAASVVEVVAASRSRVMAAARRSGPPLAIVADLAGEGARAPGPARPGGPAPSPFQKGILPGSPGAGRHEHAVVGDPLDAPGAGAQEDRPRRRAPRRPSPRRARRPAAARRAGRVPGAGSSRRPRRPTR